MADTLEHFLRFLSNVFGWIYTIAWSLSFYPQPILNFRRSSTRGTTIDFPAVNVLGFFAYFISNAAFLYSPLIRSQYKFRNDGFSPTVRFNDLAFAGHGSIVSAVCLSQFIPGLWWNRENGKADRGKSLSTSITALFIGCIVGPLIVAMVVWVRNDPNPKIGWAWIDVIYALSYVKLIITFIKYLPQVLTNYRNHSTRGWSIAQVLLDFTGGILSTLQLCIDAYLEGDWSGITGNIVKLMLGNVSMFYDCIFFVQHYLLYNSRRKHLDTDESEGTEREEDPLLDARRPLIAE